MLLFFRGEIFCSGLKNKNDQFAVQKRSKDEKAAATYMAEMCVPLRGV
jgi:hypothetical protein